MHESEANMQTYPEADYGENAGGRAFLYGLVCGAAIGALAGLMFAPKSGVDLRGEMTESARRLKRKAGEMYDEASHVVGDVAARSRRAFEAGREALYNARPADVRTSVDAPVS